MEFETILNHVITRLIREKHDSSFWQGQLSSSALSTATAVCALAIAQRETLAQNPKGPLIRFTEQLSPLINNGLQWLAKNQNQDGGWGDTSDSFSNLSTTTLVWAAFGAAAINTNAYRQTLHLAENWIIEAAGGLIPEILAPAIIRRYGKDRTFSVPILTMCALAGRLGAGKEAWRWILPLPFELSVLPHQFYASVRLPVVSYALPALIAIGQARYYHRPPWNPFAFVVRRLCRKRSLAKLSEIQPPNGGFLEATPLTSFVVMSLAASGQLCHPVTAQGIDFLVRSVRSDGSWPIDTNLATWLTTLSVNALSETGKSILTPEEKQTLLRWLLSQQYLSRHPYTGAAPGGWAWTDLPGGVPDADDTAGALLALRHLDSSLEQTRNAASNGIDWLLNLQNSDGGIPTFCRGWGHLPFDRSSPDLTAHAIRAWLVWLPDMPGETQQRLESALGKAIGYLVNTQRHEGAWLPLWFGNQHVTDDENPVYGTARVLPALVNYLHYIRRKKGGPKGTADTDQNGLSGRLTDDDPSQHPLWESIKRGIQWFISAQNPDGSWGGAAVSPPSVEETALALHALASSMDIIEKKGHPLMQSIRPAVEKGTRWLIHAIQNGQWEKPSPIGFYFAKLWYYEKLYPLIFSAAALGKLYHTSAHDFREE